MLLHRPPGTKVLTKADWHRHTRTSQEGPVGTAHPERSASVPRPLSGRTSREPSLESRATRARQLVQLGELSAARQTLTAGPRTLHTANRTAGSQPKTLRSLRDTH